MANYSISLGLGQKEGEDLLTITETSSIPGTGSSGDPWGPFDSGDTITFYVSAAEGTNDSVTLTGINTTFWTTSSTSVTYNANDIEVLTVASANSADDAITFTSGGSTPAIWTYYFSRTTIADNTPETYTNLGGNVTSANLNTNYYATFSTSTPGTTLPGTGFNTGTTIDNGTSISVTGGEYRIGTGSWTSTTGTVNQNQTVYYRRTSSSSLGGVVTGSLTIGTVTKSFTITNTSTINGTLTPAVTGITEQVDSAPTFTANVDQTSTIYWDLERKANQGTSTNTVSFAAPTSGSLAVTANTNKTFTIGEVQSNTTCAIGFRGIEFTVDLFTGANRTGTLIDSSDYTVYENQSGITVNTPEVFIEVGDTYHFVGWNQAHTVSNTYAGTSAIPGRIYNVTDSQQIRTFSVTSYPGNQSLQVTTTPPTNGSPRVYRIENSNVLTYLQGGTYTVYYNPVQTTNATNYNISPTYNSNLSVTMLNSSNQAGAEAYAITDTYVANDNALVVANRIDNAYSTNDFADSNSTGDTVFGITPADLPTSGTKSFYIYAYRRSTFGGYNQYYYRDTFTVTRQTADTTPDPFSFTDQVGVGLSSTRTSNTITVAGIDSSAAVTVSGGSYSKNGGAYTTAAGTASLGDTFSVQHTASSSTSSSVSTTLTIGGVSDTFTSTTLNTSHPVNRDHGNSIWVAMVSGTATYAAPDGSTTVSNRTPPNNTFSTLFTTGANPQRGTFSVTAGREYTSNKAIHILDEGLNHALVPFSLSGYVFASYANRNAPSTYYLYSETAAIVNVWDAVTGGLNGQPTNVISLSERTVTTFSTSTLNSWVIFSSNAPIVMSVTQNGADSMVIPPMANYAYRQSNGFEIASDNAAPSTVGTYVVYDSEDQVSAVSIADGAGGDSEQGLNYNKLSQFYTWGNTLSDFALVIPSNATIVVEDWNGSEWTTRETFTGSGSISSPNYYFRDGTTGFGSAGSTSSGTAANFNTSTLWRWRGTNVFYLRINDTSDDEETLLGYAPDITAPVISTITENGNAGTTATVTVNLTSTGSGGALKYAQSTSATPPSSSSSNWQNSNQFTQTRGTTRYYFASQNENWSGAYDTSSPYLLDYLAPDLSVSAASNITLEPQDISATVTVQNVARSTDSVAVRVNNGSTNLGVRDGNGDITIYNELPALGDPAKTFEFFTRRAESTGGDGTTWYATNDTFTIERPSTATYNITAPASINEGSSGTVSVTTTEVGTATLYWSVEPSSDFTTSEGPVSISNNSGSFSITPTADGYTEGAEAGTVYLFTDSGRTNLVASDTFVINDTSTGTPIPYGVEVFNSSGTKLLTITDRLARFVLKGTTTIAANSTSGNISVPGMENNDSWNVYVTQEDSSWKTFTYSKYSGYFTISNTSSSSVIVDYWVLRS